MAKNNKKEVACDIENNNNCVLKVKRENGYINFSIDIDDVKDVKVRLVNNNVKLATLLMHKVNKK